MKKIAILLTLVLCVTLLTVSLAACNKDDGEDLTDATAFVTVDINPSVELTLNAEGKVLSAYGANEDGKVLLYGEAGIVGESVDKAVENITRRQLGRRQHCSAHRPCERRRGSGRQSAGHLRQGGGGVLILPPAQTRRAESGKPR